MPVEVQLCITSIRIQAEKMGDTIPLAICPRPITEKTTANNNIDTPLRRQISVSNIKGLEACRTTAVIRWYFAHDVRVIRYLQQWRLEYLSFDRVLASGGLRSNRTLVLWGLARSPP